MTPLIDVIFLLLLFFMLSSTFSRFGEIELTGANAAGATESAAPLYMQLRGEEVVVNGQTVTLEALGETLAMQAANRTKLLLVSMDATTTSQRFVDVYAVARAIDGLDVAVVRSGGR